MGGILKQLQAKVFKCKTDMNFRKNLEIYNENI